MTEHNIICKECGKITGHHTADTCQDCYKTEETKIYTNNKFIKTKAIDQGIKCRNCEKQININKCATCNTLFSDDDTIFCYPQNKHYHYVCKPTEEN